MHDDDTPDLAAAQVLISDQRARVEGAIDVDGRLLFGAWGVAWLVGFAALWAAFLMDPLLPPLGGFAVLGGLLLAAGVVTTVHVSRRTAGVLGASAVQGAMYGWAWTLAFVGVFGLGAGLPRFGVELVLVVHVQTVASALLVAALYMAAGALWSDRKQFALGAWIAVVTAVAAVVGPPHTLLVMAFAGGGGMLAAAVAHHVQRTRRVASGSVP